MKEIIENFLGLGQYESLRLEIFGNSLSDFVLAAVALVVFLIIFKVLQSLVIYRLKKLAKRTETDIDDTLIGIVQTIKPPSLRQVLPNTYVYHSIQAGVLPP